MNILIIEDEEFDFLLVKRHLERAFPGAALNFEWIQVPVIADICLMVDAFDVCFVDYRLNGVSGIDLIRDLCEAGVATPLILLTGDETTELDQSAIAAGAADFLHKDKLSVHSIHRLTRFCLARKEQERRLAEMAYTDPLTALSNRAAFDQRCKVLLSKQRETSKSLAIILIDLDKFKEVNDTYGHNVGDQLLQQFSNELASHFGPADMVARLGGDEFGVLRELRVETETTDCIRTSLRAAMKSEFIVDDLTLEVFCSIGVCVVHADADPVKTTDLLHRADRNLYSDKKLRRFGNLRYHGTAEDYDLDMLVDGLESAIDMDEFEVAYQPKVNCRTGDVTGLEALLRWNSTSFDIGPAQFIPIAEEYGLIKDIGKWVLRACCEQLNKWKLGGQSIYPVAINVSPIQLEDANFAGMVELTLKEFHIDPCMIEFELTEGAFGRRLDSCLIQMERVAELGCSWAIDDFGVGYSSLSRLHKLPITRLKIDKSFLDQLPRDPAARSISNAIISMARSLDLSVVAEGVEDPDQLVGLDLADTDDLQGYHCYLPMRAHDVTAVLTPSTKVYTRA